MFKIKLGQIKCPQCDGKIKIVLSEDDEQLVTVAVCSSCGYSSVVALESNSSVTDAIFRIKNRIRMDEYLNENR